MTGKASVGGGGVMIIYKTDKVAPLISNIKVEDIKSDAVRITWQTNENAFGFVEYGDTLDYGRILGHYITTISHFIFLDNLTVGTKYHYRITSVDSSGNLAQTQDQIFNTSEKTVTELETEVGQDQENQKTEA